MACSCIGAQGVLVYVMSSVIHPASTHHLPHAKHWARLPMRKLPTSSWTKLKGFVQLPLPQRGRKSISGTFDILSLGIEFGSKVHLKFHIPLTKIWNFWTYKRICKHIVLPSLTLSSLVARFCLPSKSTPRNNFHIFCFFFFLFSFKDSLFSFLREFESDADFFSS